MRLTAMSVVLLCFSVVGCGKPAPDPDSMVPDAVKARRAIEIALTSWVDEDSKPQMLEGVRVQHMDRRRAQGQHPTSYEVAGSVREDWARGFVVRLTWADLPEPETVTYLVTGIDPMWVLRRDEIELLLHWEHAMDDPNAPDRRSEDTAGEDRR
jgi:hypothetical protein